MNQYKKGWVLFLITAFVAIAFLPVVNYLKNQDMTATEDWFNTDFVESYVNFAAYKIFNKSTDPMDVIVGKNGFMFLGNKHNKLLYKTIDEYPYSAQQIENWTSNLYQLQQWYEAEGIQFITVIAPNKHSIYPEMLPRWLVPAQINLTDILVQSAKNQSINLLDLRPLLLDSKVQNHELLYWKSDSHWNELGASIGFQATINSVNDIYFNELLVPNYQFEAKPVGAIGGHARFLKIRDLLPNNFETNISTLIEQENNVCVGQINEASYVLNPCEMKTRPYLDIHQGPQYSINQQALNQKKVLLLCDSFVMQNSNLYNKTFATIWKHKYNDLKGEKLKAFINKHKPDIVIYQVVERSLFNNSYIDINTKIANNQAL